MMQPSHIMPMAQPQRGVLGLAGQAALRSAAPISFADSLSRAESAAEGLPLSVRPTQPASQLREAAGKLVASALLKPAMELMHQSPFRTTGPLAPGTAERRFAPLLDQELADRVVSSANFKLVDAIVERFERMGRAEGGAAMLDMAPGGLPHG